MPVVPDEPNWVSMSELGDYEFCPRSWWYSRHGETLAPSARVDSPSASFSRGVRVHRQLETAHVRVQAGSALGYATVATLSVALAALLLWWLFP